MHPGDEFCLSKEGYFSQRFVRRDKMSQDTENTRKGNTSIIKEIKNIV